MQRNKWGTRKERWYISPWYCLPGHRGRCTLLLDSRPLFLSSAISIDSGFLLQIAIAVDIACRVIFKLGYSPLRLSRSLSFLSFAVLYCTGWNCECHVGRKLSFVMPSFLCFIPISVSFPSILFLFFLNGRCYSTHSSSPKTLRVFCLSCCDSRGYPPCGFFLSLSFFLCISFLPMKIIYETRSAFILVWSILESTVV